MRASPATTSRRHPPPDDTPPGDTPDDDTPDDIPDDILDDDLPGDDIFGDTPGDDILGDISDGTGTTGTTGGIDQYTTDDTAVEVLPDTGGAPLLPITALLLIAGGGLTAMVLVRRLYS